MKKLNKATLAERDEIAGKLRDRADDARKAIDAFNEAMGAKWAIIEAALADYNEALEEEWEKVQTEVEAYNEVIQEANDWKTGVATEIDNYTGERSDKWQESDAAQRYESWKESYDEMVEALEVEKPDPLELEHDDELLSCDIGDEGDALVELPEEVEA